MDPQLSFPFDDDLLEVRLVRHTLPTGKDADTTTLYVCESSNYVALTDDQVLDYAGWLLGLRLRRGAEVMKTPAAIRDFLRFKLSRLDYEVFGCLYLDAHHRLIEMEELFRGTIDKAIVYPREVVKAALRHAASAVVVYHNHPSGFTEPSSADEHITKRLKAALAPIDVTILDHLIIGDSIFSFSEHGLL